MENIDNNNNNINIELMFKIYDAVYLVYCNYGYLRREIFDTLDPSQYELKDTQIYEHFVEIDKSVLCELSANKKIKLIKVLLSRDNQLIDCLTLSESEQFNPFSYYFIYKPIKDIIIDKGEKAIFLNSFLVVDSSKVQLDPKNYSLGSRKYELFYQKYRDMFIFFGTDIDQFCKDSGLNKNNIYKQEIIDLNYKARLDLIIKQNVRSSKYFIKSLAFGKKSIHTLKYDSVFIKSGFYNENVYYKINKKALEAYTDSTSDNIIDCYLKNNYLFFTEAEFVCLEQALYSKYCALEKQNTIEYDKNIIKSASKICLYF